MCWFKRVALLAIPALFVACGSAVYHHEVTITLNYDSADIRDKPVQVSIFDHMMGYSRDWAQKSMGVSTPSQPYIGSFTTVGSATIFQSTPPSPLEIAFTIPLLSSEGYYLLPAELPTEGRDARAAFVQYNSYFPEPNAGSLPVHYSGVAKSDGWRVQISVIAPPDKAAGHER